jgi:hypothetical protein
MGAIIEIHCIVCDFNDFAGIRGCDEMSKPFIRAAPLELVFG